MTKDIKDYLHYYLRSGLLCKVKRKNDTNFHTGKLCEVTYKSNHGDWASFWFEDIITVTSQTFETSSSNNHWFFFSEDTIIPYLRPLASMTEEEASWIVDNTNLKSVTMGRTEKEFAKALAERWSVNSNVIHYLLQQGFDLFNLIESGLAIDKSKTN